VSNAETHSHADQEIEIITHRLDDGVVLLEVSGEIDMLTAPVLRRHLVKDLSEDCRHLVLDLNKVTFLGSSGLSVLVEATRLTENKHASLALVCSNRSVVRPLEATGLTEVFATFDTSNAAVAAMTGR
jgi:anti-anti-sigma factor